jgi:VWFA-related protein
VLLIVLLPLLIPAQAEPESAIIRSSARLVQVNVVAQDGAGAPITDLTRDDFVLYDKGAKQKIGAFGMETGDIAAGTVLKPAAANVFTNRPDTSSKAVTVLLFDEANSRPDDLKYAKDQVARYLKELGGNQRIALFILKQHLRLAHDFTSDTAELIAALNRDRGYATTAVQDTEPAASNTGDARADAFTDQANRAIADYTSLVRADNTAAAFEAIARHTSRIPGRKNLVWISGGFPMVAGWADSYKDPLARPSPANKTYIANSSPTSFTAQAERASRALNEANVALYPVGIHGLPVVFSVTNSWADRGLLDPNFDSLALLAGDTGGRAYRNINALGEALHDALRDASLTYTLGFYPPSKSLDGKYHPLKVEVKRKGVHLHYRLGYFATPEPAPLSLEQALAEPLGVSYVGVSARLDKQPNGLKATITVDPRDVTFREQNGIWSAAVEMVYFAVMPGTAANTHPTLKTLALTREQYDQVLKDGVVFVRQLSPSPGQELSIAVRDMNSGNVGSLRLLLGQF